MKKSDELKQKRTALITEQETITDTAMAQNRSIENFTEEEKTAFDAKQTEIRNLNKAIERAEASEANEAFTATRTITPVTTSVVDGEAKEKSKVYERASILKAIRNANPANSEQLDGAEKEMHEIGLQETRNAGVPSDQNSTTHLSIPLRYLSTRATQQTVTQDGGEYGGALVQNQAPRMVDPLRPKLALEGLGATFLTGLTGGNIPLVVDNDFTMTFLPEGVSITPQKKKYAGPVLAPKRAGGSVDLTNQYIMQTSLDVENKTMNGLRNGFSQLLHSTAINGPGGDAPLGLLSYAGVNAASDAAAVAASWAKIVELQALIEESDSTMDNLGFVLHPKLKAALKQIKKDAGSGRFLLDGNSIDGLPFVSTSQMPVLDAGGTPVYPLIYGDFSQMVIGQWGSINVKINPYSADLADSVRLTLNTHADMQIANPKAFAKNAFLTDAVS